MTQPAARDRPREKLGRLGVAALGDNELLALVLGSGTRRAGALALANLVLEAAGGLHGLPGCTGDEMRRTPGVGAAKAAQVLAAVELGRRTLLRQPADRPQLLTPGEVAAMREKEQEAVLSDPAAREVLEPPAKTQKPRPARV